MTPLCSCLSPGVTGGPLPRPLLQTPSLAWEPFNSRWFSGVKLPWQDPQLRAPPFLGLQERGEDGRKEGGWPCVWGSFPGSFLYIFTHLVQMAPSDIHSFTHLVQILCPVSPSPHGLPRDQQAAPAPTTTPPLLSVCSLGPRGFTPLTPALFPS